MVPIPVAAHRQRQFNIVSHLWRPHSASDQCHGRLCRSTPRRSFKSLPYYNESFFTCGSLEQSGTVGALWIPKVCEFLQMSAADVCLCETTRPTMSSSVAPLVYWEKFIRVVPRPSRARFENVPQMTHFFGTKQA
jgi:hypothetical protein